MSQRRKSSSAGTSPRAVLLPSPASGKARRTSQSKQPKQQNQTKENTTSKLDHEIEAADGFKSFAIKLACVLFSLMVIHLSPRSSEDAFKPEGVSFFSLYFAGKLDHVNYITQMLLAAFFSVFLDLGVVKFHLEVPPHPKFVMMPQRRASIYTHLISGITEIVCGVLAFTVSDSTTQKYCAILLSLASITHSITAYLQTSLVFGAKGVMVPGYLYVITLHITNAFRLYQNPTSILNLIITYLMLHVYVWCRFFIWVFRTVKLFTGYHYTVAITLSGLLLIPYAVGPVGNIGALGAMILYCVLEIFTSDKPKDQIYEKLFVEHERYALISQEHSKEWKKNLHASGNGESDVKMAREVFDRIDTDKSGKLEVNEIHNMLAALNLPSYTVSSILKRADPDNSNDISFDEFYNFIWNIGSIHQRLKKLPKTQEHKLSEKDKAKLVFDMLDIDGSNSIGLAELDMLLTQWGMPAQEASAYLQKEMGGKEEIQFDAFFEKMKPIWSFAATYIFN